MDANKVKHAAIVGAGKMGNSIALVLSRAGIDVDLLDVDERLLNNALTTIRSSLETLAEHGTISADDIPAMLNRIHPCTELAALHNVEFIEEAVPEVPEIKKQVLAQLDAALPPNVIIASNTSGLDIFGLADFNHPERLVIAHWFLPAHIIPLVEVVPGPLTRLETVTWTVALLERLGKKPVAMKGFTRSFIVNKIQNAMAMAAMELLGTGLVTPQDVDSAIKSSLGVRLPIVGVVQSWDFMGLDLGHAINQSLNLNCPIVEEQVAAGHLGVKTGKGIYDYGGRSELEILKKRDVLLLHMLDYLAQINAFEPI